MSDASRNFQNVPILKKLFVVAFMALSVVAAKAQSYVSIASGLDSLDEPIYDDIYLFDSDEQVPFYIIVDDTNPVICSKMKVKAYYKDYTNGKSEDNYWVYQGEFEYPIEPNYYGYWLQMYAYTAGDYKIEVSGYMANGTYDKYFGSAEFTVYSEDEFWYGAY